VIPGTSSPLTRVERIGLVLGLAVAGALMWPTRHYLTDDTFIHLQYARHLASGQGLVFNVGERVYGCTSPLWVTLLADGMALGFDGLTTARVVGFLATLASVGLFLQLMRRTLKSPVVRAAATVAWASHAWMIRWSLSGMETPLAVALVLAGFVAFTEGERWGARPVRTGALWSLAALTRPEAVLLLLLWGAFLLIEAEDRDGVRRLIAGVIPPAAIYGTWLLFSRLYFGTFWPQTLSAKTAGGYSLPFHVHNLWRQIQVAAASDGILAVVLGLALLLGGRRVWTRRGPASRLLPWAWVVSLPVLYLARGVPVLSRYLLTLLPVLAWLAWRAAERWCLGPDPTPARMRRAGWLGVGLAAAVMAQNFMIYRGAVLPQVLSFTPALESSLVHWGRWFQAHTAADAVIATPDIGAIGYFSQRRVVDLAGLVTPAMVPHLMRETQEDAVAGFRFATFSRPDYLVDRAATPNALMTSSPFAKALVPLGHARVPNLGIARPGPAVYSFYRVDWNAFDSLRARRAAPAPAGR
jgi:arabinofuranosyltransferase